MSIKEYYKLIQEITHTEEYLLPKLALGDQQEISEQLTALKLFLSEQISYEHNNRKFDIKFVEEKVSIIKQYLEELKQEVDPKPDNDDLNDFTDMLDDLIC